MSEFSVFADFMVAIPLQSTDGVKAAMCRHKFFRVFALLCAVSLGSAVLAGCGEKELPSPYQAIDVGWQHEGADFHLADPTGRARSLADFRDKVIVLFFGYTHCPDVCPTTLADMAQVMRLLGKQADQVQVLFVTLDPERDTGALLAQYVPAFYPSFMGLRGDAQATAEAARSFGVSYQKQMNKSGYTLDHSSSLYLIGMNGRPMLLAPYDQGAELLVQDIRLLLTTSR